MTFWGYVMMIEVLIGGVYDVRPIFSLAGVARP